MLSRNDRTNGESAVQLPGAMDSAEKRGKPGMGRRFPIGVEKVLCLAGHSPEFRELLLADRERALEESGFDLRQSEVAILSAIPPRALSATIGKVGIGRPRRRRFMAAVTACALAVTTAMGAADCGPAPGHGGAPGEDPGKLGIRDGGGPMEGGQSPGDRAGQSEALAVDGDERAPVMTVAGCSCTGSPLPKR